jgi:hypothetical protein
MSVQTLVKTLVITLIITLIIAYFLFPLVMVFEGIHQKRAANQAGTTYVPKVD